MNRWKNGCGRTRALVLACLLASVSLPSEAADPVIATAGDIACDPTDPLFNDNAGTVGACQARATSNLLVSGGFDAVLPLGDIQYYDGAPWKWAASYDRTWGRLKAISKPTPGNHDYYTAGATGYFNYFGAAAGDRTKGYYSYNLGTWHLIALNSNCGDVGGCGPSSPQAQWLAADLAANPKLCTLAYWHHPRFSSGTHGDDPAYDTFWRLLYDAGVDVVLNGHEHDYERFAPQDPQGRADAQRGIRQFVVGTGGIALRPFETVRPNSEVRQSGTHGVLKLSLRPTGYDWQFLPVPGRVFSDSGSGACHPAKAETVLSLRDGRFEAEVRWRDFSANTGAGNVVPMANSDSGVFSFFDPDNWELLVKVIDGCALNNRYWVFAAGITNVEYELTVTDTQRGLTATYRNPLSRTSPAITDTAAFASCP